MIDSSRPSLTSHQRIRATLIAMHVRNELEQIHGGGSALDFTDEGGDYRGLTDEQMALINPIVRNAVADILHAIDNLELPAARQLLEFTEMLVPDYWEPPVLTDDYRELLAVREVPVPCRRCGRPVFQIGDRWFHRDAQGQRIRGCYAASFVSDEGWDTSINRTWKALPPLQNHRTARSAQT